MTKAQVKYIIENICNDECDKVTPLLGNNKIVMNNNTILLTDLYNYRYKFDSSNELLYRYKVRVYSNNEEEVPSHGHYDTYTVGDKTYVFEYLVDKNNNALFDVFDIDKIKDFVIKDTGWGVRAGR